MFVDLIISKIQAGNRGLGRTTRFVLLNIDLMYCMDSCLESIEEIFDVLLEDIASSDFLTISTLHRQTTRAYISKLQRQCMAISTVEIFLKYVPKILFLGLAATM